MVVSFCVLRCCLYHLIKIILSGFIIIGSEPFLACVKELAYFCCRSLIKPELPKMAFSLATFTFRLCGGKVLDELKFNRVRAGVIARAG